MAGPEGFIQPDHPQNNAVTYLAPKIHEAQQALENRGSFITPEGYNVHTVEGAERYLREVHNMGERLDKIRVQRNLDNGLHLPLAVQREPRAALYENGDRQNVAEHSHNVAFASAWIAFIEDRPEVDPYIASTKATFHDAIVEAYGGDTPIYDPVKMASKESREAAGMTLFLHDAGDSPIGRLMLGYELRLTPTDRFVNGIDKVEPYWVALANNTVEALVGDEDYHDIVLSALVKAVIDPTAFKKMCDALVNLGEVWPKNCKPFEGNPGEIVASYAKAIFDQGAEVIKLPTVRETDVDNSQLGELMRFPLKGMIEVIPQSDRLIIEPEILRQLGVSIIGKASSDKSTPPQPPTTAGFALAAA